MMISDVLYEYCRKWNLSNPAKIAETFTSHVFKVSYQNRTAVLKVLTIVGQKHEAKGPVVLRCFEGNGAVRLLNADEGAYLLEFVDGRHLKDLVANSGDDKATEIICDVLNQIHSYAGPKPSDLISMTENFRGLFARAKIEPPDSIFSFGAKVALRLIETERDPHVLHGDIHHKNILESKDRGWLAIDPQCLYGERTYDVANSFFNPDDMPDLVETQDRIEKCCQIFSRRLNLDSKRILEFAFAYGCLSSAWCIEDGHNPERRLRITRLIQDLL